MSQRFYVETLGCPKNQVDSDKLVGTLLADGMAATDDAAAADLVVVNTCAFIEDARQESIDTILALDEQRQDGARLVVTGCMAERYGDELAAALPEVDQVAGFGVRSPPRRRDGTAGHAQADPGVELGAAARRSTCSTCRGPKSAVAVGLRQDRRGLRPHVRVLRHPVVPRAAAQPRRRRRSSTRSTSSARARSCSSPRTWRRTARIARASSAPARSCRSCEAVADASPIGSACCTSTRATSPTS